MYQFSLKSLFFGVRLIALGAGAIVAILDVQTRYPIMFFAAWLVAGLS